MTRKERFDFVTDYFRKHHPEAETELHYSNPFELLVAVVLSAQCTDKRVNLVTPALFKAFPGPRELSTAKAEEIFPYIRSVSYPNNKAKHLEGLGRMLMGRFKGKIPSSIEALQELPGVGRKTANVVASVVFNQPAMAVDTHVFRVSARMGLTLRATTPLAAEKQLVKYFPEDTIATAHHWLILHGRYVCTARNPKCEQCGIAQACAYFSKKKRTTPAKRIKSV